MGRPARSATMASLTLLALASGCNELPSSPSALAVSSASLATVSRTDLGTLGGAHSYATDINDAGVVVGWSEDATGVHRAFRWTPALGMTDLGTLPADQWSRAISITSTGQILGVSGRTDDYYGTPVVWAPSGNAAPLAIPLVPGATDIMPADRNGSGEVTGSGVGGSLLSHAWVWSRSLGLYDITAHIRGGSFESYGNGINSAGLVVGTNHATVCSGPTVSSCWHAFVWRSSTGYRDIGIPSGNDLRTAQVTGSALNDMGVVAGWTSPDGSNRIRPFRWIDRTGFTVLATFSAYPDIYGYGQSVNAASTVVGASMDAQDGTIQAAAWPTAGGIVKLSTDDPNPSVAVSVNAFGVVAGWSALDCCGAANHATLWKVGPGGGVSTPTLASASRSSAVAARVRSQAAQSGPVGCLSDPHALLSRQSLIDCVVKRGK